ncbi:lysoplasmalogenase [Mongoliitalea daihaiensis]|uniref:lysoplasmalogenase n=1 Tax=Mongoliitalea daihaiensis TaxID=2782006 RepID=UPI001F3F77FD|nr:lysoplasmalogenase [Mongoliitalea daihaiensis]UJP65829.1 lysoplasmalogenase [Mongoliitalea daihaiensis]
MKKKNILWLYLFLLVSMLDIFLTANGQQEERLYTKTLIMPLLGMYFWQVSHALKNTYIRKAMMAALIFSWIGDTLLLWQQLFLYGLGAFFMAHICYIFAFKISQKQPFKIGTVNFLKLFLYNLPFYIGAAFVYFLVNPGLGPMKIPVVAYIIIIVMMATTARERYKETSPESFWQVLIGASLFMISDSIIAINLFFKPFPEASVLIMGSYVVAQLLIVRGIQAHYQ